MGAHESSDESDAGGHASVWQHAGSGTYSIDPLSIYVKWLATFAGGQNFIFYVNSSGLTVMVGQTGETDNPVLDGWMSLQ